MVSERLGTLSSNQIPKSYFWCYQQDTNLYFPVDKYLQGGIKKIADKDLLVNFITGSKQVRELIIDRSWKNSQIFWHFAADTHLALRHIQAAQEPVFRWKSVHKNDKVFEFRRFVEFNTIFDVHCHICQPL